jgi:putative pyrroloquinoline-quinone binding quinoprotein
MRALKTNCERFRSILSVLVIGLLFNGKSIYAQPFPMGFLVQPTQVELTAPHVEVVAGATAARLEQARQLSAARDWDEAINIYLELRTDRSNRVVALDGNRYLSLRNYCHVQIARLPAEGLAAYRRRVDPAAEKLYRDGLANRDESLLRRIVDESFCSSWGDDALMVLGELALEHGDYASARRAWEQINPQLSAPNGSPPWLALRDIDLNAKWPEVERLWQTREKPADWLAYPDSPLALADVRARLVLTSIRAGQLDRAALELKIFRRLHPDATGEFGGQKENLAAALDRLLAAAREWPADSVSIDWPTFAGSHSRSTVAAAVAADLVSAWREPVSLTPCKYMRSVRLVQGGAGGDTSAKELPNNVVRESERPLGCYPAVVGGTIFYADGSGIHAAELATGKATVTTNGLLHRSELADEKDGQVPLGIAGGVAHGVPRLTLDAVDGVVYSRVGTLVTSRAQALPGAAGDRIVGLDVRREGLLTFQSPREEGAWAFDGAPVSDGRRVFVAMRSSDVTPRAYVACFDAATGVRQWRTPIGAADTIAGGAADEITHNLLTLVEGRIYFNTNLGLVAALEANTGDVAWITRYDRLVAKTFTLGSAVPLNFDRDPSPCVYHDGLLFVAPSDTPAIFALDADTGKMVWQQSQVPDALQLLGVVGKRLIASGERMASLDISSGHVNWTWPESDRAGIRGMGRGVLAGNEIFWPTRTEILVIDPKTGSQTRSPISLSPLAGGANLAASSGRLIVAGYDKLIVLGPPRDAAPEPIDAARTGRLGQPAADRSAY